MRLGILTAFLLIFSMQHIFHCSPDVVPGYLDFDNLPDTNFSCEGKVIGGYYADVETGCQMFHVCTVGQKGETTDIKFLCLNGTVFDQETRVCERVDEVDCSKTEGFYNLNLELYGNSAALSFQEEDSEEEEGERSEENVETTDTSYNDALLKYKTSTSKASTQTSSSPNPITAHPASTATSKTPPLHPFVPTTTYKPNQHLTHFHSTTAPGIAAFLAINNAFSSATSNQEGNKFGDNSNQYDEDEEEEEEEEEEIEEAEENDSVTERPGIVISGGTSHLFPVTTAGSQIQPVIPGHHNILQQNVKVHGTGESGVILNQANKQQPQKSHSTSETTANLYGHQSPFIVKDTCAHSKHQLNTQFILNQQRDNDNKQHHGFKPIPNPDSKSPFLFSSTTLQPPVLFTTKSPSQHSARTIELFSHHAGGTQSPLHATLRPPNSAPFPPQTNAHQVPPNPLIHPICANIASNGDFLPQTIQISQNPLNFQFNSNGNNRQLFTTPSVAVVATTSSTSSSSSARTGSMEKVGNISPVVSLTSSIGNTPKTLGVTNKSSVSIQLFTETTPSHSYDEYQEGDVHSDPFFRDVPKIPKTSTTLKTPSHVRHGIVRNKRESLKKILVKTKSVLLPLHNNLRYKRKAATQIELPKQIFGTGNRSRSEGPNRSLDVESSLKNKELEEVLVESQFRRTSIPEQLESKQNIERSRLSSFVSYEVSTVVPEVTQQAPQYSRTVSDISLPNSTSKHLESTVLNYDMKTGNRQGRERTHMNVTRPSNKSAAGNVNNHHPSEISALTYRTENFQQFKGDQNLHIKSNKRSSIPAVVTSGTKSNSYRTPKESVWIGAEGSQTSQNFTINVPIVRSRGIGQHRPHQYQPSQSNLVQEARVDSHSQRSRQGNRQRTRIVAYKDNGHLQRIPLTSHPKGDTNATKAASIRANRRYDSKSIDEETLYNHQAHPPSKILNRGRKLHSSSNSHNVTMPDSNKVITPNRETNIESSASTETQVESSHHPQNSVPKTNFTCADKIPGGYYADLEADCQLFHICSMGRHSRIIDNMFLCGPGTRFDQRSRTCQAMDLVNCSLSASLYYLNSHFDLKSPDDTLMHGSDFEAKKIRTRRETTKGTLPGRNKQPHYSIDSLPETSFTCSDKSQDGLYADVETQCQVFHLCRTISGTMTLESSFVCPPGTVFNQPEGNCDSKNEVDCALYSTPEHTFKKIGATGTRKSRHTLTEVTQMKLGSVTSAEQDAVMIHKNYRMKRETTKETFDYYDYIDDNYEAHAIKSMNSHMPATSDKIQQSQDNTAISETEHTAAEYPYLFQSHKNENVGQKYIFSADSDQRNKGPELFESFEAHTTDSTLLLHTESVAGVEEIISAPIPYQLVLKNKTAIVVGDQPDYIYEYEHDDEGTVVTSVVPDLEQTTSALDNRSVKNDMKSTTSDPTYDEKNSNTFLKVETSGHIKNDANFATVTHKMVDSVKLPTNTTQNILEINRSGKITTKNQTLETDILEKVHPTNVYASSNDYDYEYDYDYDKNYADSKETESDSSNKHLPSVQGEDQPLKAVNKHDVTTDSGDKRHGSAHNVATDNINSQIPRQFVDMDIVSDTHETVNFNSTLKASTKLNIEPAPLDQVSAKTPVDFETVFAALNEKKATSTQRVIISDVFETYTNPSPFQELDSRTKGTPPAVHSYKKLQESNDDSNGNNDDITLAPHTTELHKQRIGVDSKISDLAVGKEIAAKHEMSSATENGEIIYSKAVSSDETTQSLGSTDYGTPVHQEESSSYVGDTRAYVQLSSPLQDKVSSSKPTQKMENLTAFTELALRMFYAQTPSQSAAKSMVQQLESHSTFGNHSSSSVPPPFVLQSRGIKSTIERNSHSVTTNSSQNNMMEDKGNPRTLHRFRLAHNENYVEHIPQQVNVMSFAADNPVTYEKGARSQNTVLSTQSSEMPESEKNSSAAPHVVFSSDDDYGTQTETHLPFNTNSKTGADSVHKLLYPASGSTDSTLSSKPPVSDPIKMSTPSPTGQYDSHKFMAVNSSIAHNMALNHLRVGNASLDHAFRNILQLSGENLTPGLVFSINNLAIPVTTTSSASDVPVSDPTDVTPNTPPPSSHLGYTLSAVTSQPSLSADTKTSTGFVCTGRELHQYHPDTNDCRMFHYCSPGFHEKQVLDFRFICQNGTAFKADTHKCENEFLVPTCTNLK